MINQSLFDANLRFFEQNFPALYERIRAQGPLLAQPVIEDGAIIDIDLGSDRLYKNDARRTSKEQAEFFAAAPARSGYKGVEGITSDSMVSRRFFEGMVAGMREHDIRDLSPTPVGRSAYMFIFGVGLGYHLPHLAEKIDVDHFVVLEAADEFLSLSMRCIDYAQLNEDLKARGATLHFVVSQESLPLNAGMLAVVDACGEIFLDGVYLYRHYPFWPLDEAYNRFLVEIPFRLIGRGYYEDERKMIRNAAANLHKFDHYLLTGNFRRRYDIPAFIIAAGPSLDESLDYIRQWQNHAIIFSAGTAIQPLLAAGITPDYHVELENTPHTFKMCEYILERNKEQFPDGKFSGVKMLGSVTVNPRVPALFDENYFFYRDLVVSTTAFGQGVTVMNGVAPCIANTAVAVAARLGFETMYLFGSDCGWRDARHHHSKNTIYYTIDEYELSEKDKEYATPGNFGGTIYSNLVLTWTREMLEQKIQIFKLTAFNCSDGAFIKGSIPKLVETLDFPQIVDKEAVFKRIRDESVFYAAPDYLAKQDVDGMIAGVELLRADLMAMLDGIERDDVDFYNFIAQISDFDREAWRGPYKHIHSLFQGSLIGFTKAASYYLNRIEDEDKRRGMFKVFLKLYRELHEEMLDEGKQTFEEIKLMKEQGIEPVWADGVPVVEGTTY